MNTKTVSKSWNIDEESQTHITIKNIDVPNNLHCLMIGRTIKGEPFGNGYEMYLSEEELLKLRNTIDGYLFL